MDHEEEEPSLVVVGHHTLEQTESFALEDVLEDPLQVVDQRELVASDVACDELDEPG